MPILCVDLSSRDTRRSSREALHSWLGERGDECLPTDTLEVRSRNLPSTPEAKQDRLDLLQAVAAIYFLDIFVGDAVLLVSELTPLMGISSTKKMTLNVRRVEGDAEDERELLGCFRDHPNLSCFRLLSTSLIPVLANGIIRSLSTNPRLKDVFVWDALLDMPSLGQLFQSTTLESFELHIPRSLRVAMDASQSARQLWNDCTRNLPACTQLVRVDVRWAYISSPIMLGLCSLPALESLKLSVNGNEDFVAVSNAVATNRCLEKLLIDKNCEFVANFRAAEAMGSMLRINETIEDLSLFLEFESIMPVANALQTSNRTLENFKFLVSSLSQECRNLFGKVLESNFVLEELEILRCDWANDPSNLLEDDPRISFFLHLNQRGTLRALLEDPDTTNNDWIEAALADEQDPSIFYYYLSKSPGLFSSQPMATELSTNSTTAGGPLVQNECESGSTELDERPKKRAKVEHGAN